MSSEPPKKESGCGAALALVLGLVGLAVSALCARGYLGIDGGDSEWGLDSLPAMILRVGWVLGIVMLSAGFAWSLLLFRRLIWPSPEAGARWSVKRVLATSGTALWGVVILANVIVLIKAPAIVMENVPWYKIPPQGDEYGVGRRPRSIAFDGVNVWVGNYGNGTVTVLRASDGSLVGTYPAGTTPSGVAFDGANVWVANRDSGSVTRLGATDGSIAGSLGVGGFPQDVVFDGANIWVATGSSQAVVKIRASDGSPLGTFQIGTDACHLAFDGTYVWVAGADRLVKLEASDGSLVGTYPLADRAGDLISDGVNIWVQNAPASTVNKIRGSDGAALGTYVTFVPTQEPPPAGLPRPMAFDGKRIWVSAGYRAVHFRASDGSHLETHKLRVCLLEHSQRSDGDWSDPQGMVFDGTSIWVTNSFCGTVTRLRVAA
jgi:hypothetical protein